MLKFRHFIVEMAALKSRGNRLEYEHGKYLAPYLPGGKLHTGNPTHELNTSHTAKGGEELFKKGENVSIHGVKDIDGVRHLEVKNAEGKTGVIPANKLNKVGGRASKDQERAEAEQIAKIHEHITNHLAKTGQTSTMVEFPDGTKAKVAGIARVNETDKNGRKVKADAYFHDENGKPVHYMSLKSNTFQQYSGVSDIAHHPTIKDAVKKLGSAAAKDTSKAHHYSLEPENSPEHKKIIHQAMYGTEHGGAFGNNNVHAIYRGNIGLSPNESGGLTLSASTFSSNKNNSEKSDYVPAKIVRRNASDRNDMGIKNSRVGIFSAHYRKNTVETKDAQV